MTHAYLADTSAWHRSGATPEILDRWSELLASGSIAITSPVRLELLYSARSKADYVALADELTSLREIPLDEAVAARAGVVQAGLAERSNHRGPTPADLYIAAAAELAGATLLHYDRHFDAIARISGQPAEWIAPRGSLSV
ncbi:MAG: PIN domain-containing protein [Gaiella sp.]